MDLLISFKIECILTGRGKHRAMALDISRSAFFLFLSAIDDCVDHSVVGFVISDFGGADDVSVGLDCRVRVRLRSFGDLMNVFDLIEPDFGRAWRLVRSVGNNDDITVFLDDYTVDFG